MSTSKAVLNILSFCISILIFVLVIFGLIQVGGMAYDMGYRVFTEQPMTGEPGRDVVVEVTEHMSAHQLGTVLEEKGLVDNAWLFAVQMQLSAYAKKVNPGLYTLNTSQTAREMLMVMSAKTETEEEKTTK